MNNINDLFKGGLDLLIKQSPGSLVYASQTVTCYKSVYRDNNRTQEITGFDDSLDNLYVLCKASDVSTWDIEPLQSHIVLDGVEFCIGKSITKNESYWTIWLRSI